MSEDFSEPDRRGLADWVGDCGVPGRREVPEQRGPAYVVSFGWLPAQLPPAAGEWVVPESLIPAPRQAPDDRP